jgi:hypothetical protein
MPKRPKPALGAAGHSRAVASNDFLKRTVPTASAGRKKKADAVPGADLHSQVAKEMIDA